MTVAQRIPLDDYALSVIRKRLHSELNSEGLRNHYRKDVRAMLEEIDALKVEIERLKADPSFWQSEAVERMQQEMSGYRRAASQANVRLKEVCARVRMVIDEA